jgi:hypothetical protein
LVVKHRSEKDASMRRIRRRLRARLAQIVGWLCLGGSVVLLLAGAWAGWIAPRLDPSAPTVAALQAALDTSNQAPTVFLGADLTTLGVIIAIIIGYNVAAFQVAAQSLSLTLVRAILYTLLPFLGLWLAATTIAMVYLLTPPPVTGDLYQVACWFGATALALIGYLVALPSRLSGDYVARWSLNDLRGVPIAEWESTDGYTVLQYGISTAVGRADISTLRTLILPLAHVLAGRCDLEAERRPGYNRARFYALRNLLAGCAPYTSSAPGGIWYVLGFLEGGIILQASAVGAPSPLLHATLFDDGVPNGKAAFQNIVSLWAGLRHALCRPGIQGMPYLRQYWHEHRGWPSEDARRSDEIAEILMLLHGACWREMAASSMTPAEVADQCADLLSELYRYLWQYLLQGARSGVREQATLLQQAATLMTAIHERALGQWPENQEDSRDKLEVVYKLYQERLDAQTEPSKVSSV